MLSPRFMLAWLSEQSTQPKMTKFIKHRQKVSLWNKEFEVDGHLFFLDEYPTIQLFVAKNPNSKLYVVCEPQTGLKCGGCHEKTRALAVTKQLEVFENMRNSENGQGKHSFVIEMIEGCVKSALKT